MTAKINKAAAFFLSITEILASNIHPSTSVWVILLQRTSVSLIVVL